MKPAQFGDDLLHMNGIGERVTFAMDNNDDPSDADKQGLFEVYQWAAQNRQTVTHHCHNDASVHHLLDVFARVNAQQPIADLRWTIAHLNDASDETLRRMKDLGVGWTMQGETYFKPEYGGDNPERNPSIVTAIDMDLRISAGTDAHRVATCNPFVTLQGMLDGKTVAGNPTRDAAQLPDREQALRLYTVEGAWVAHDDDVRGTLEVGKLADLAVLSADYMTVPAEQISGIESVLRMVGGKIV